MVDVKKIIVAIETMGKKMEQLENEKKQLEKENGELRLKIWEKDQENNRLKTELEQWRNGSR